MWLRRTLLILTLLSLNAEVHALTLTPQQRLIADQIISIFENDDPTIQYGYAAMLGDGRGITAGRAGFTSATGDMLEVIERYSAIQPDNSLAAYLPRLRQLAQTEDDSTHGLQGLPEQWRQESKHAVFRNVQDEVVDEVYYLPAMQRATDLDARLPLTLLCLYDAIIQHGEGDDPDGLPAMIARTNQKMSGTPGDGVDEQAWLKAFLKIRKQVLRHPDNWQTQEEWSQSTGRVDALMKLLKQGNMDLHAPVIVAPWGESFTLPSLLKTP